MRVQHSIDELRIAKMSAGAINNDGMPHAHNITDLSSYASRLDELQRTQEERIAVMINQLEVVQKTINNLKNVDERTVLQYRFIEGLSVDDTAEAMKYTPRTILRFQKHGIINIRIPRKMS